MFRKGYCRSAIFEVPKISLVFASFADFFLNISLLRMNLKSGNSFLYSDLLKAIVVQINASNSSVQFSRKKGLFTKFKRNMLLRFRRVITRL